jgi:hypothetical protein
METTYMSAPNELDPFTNLDHLRVSQDFETGAGVKKLLTVVPVRKPGRQVFFRVHPDPSFRLNGALIIELKEERETYLVLSSLEAEIADECSVCCVYTVLSRQGVISLWPVKLPTPDGRHNAWHSSAADAAERAMTQWVRIAPNMALGAYEISVPEARFPDPVWPDIAFSELLRIGFRDHLVDHISHPLIKRLRGAV